MAKTVSVSVDKGCLRLQFTSSVSQKIWGKKQKYKSLGLSDTPENWLIAEDLAFQARQDIYRDNFDVTLKRYDPHALPESSKKITPKIPGLLELYNQYLEEIKKPCLANSTYILNYSGSYRRVIKLCANTDIIKDARLIFDTINKSKPPDTAKRILDILFNMFDWCKRKEFIEKDAYNPYRDYKKDVVGKSKRIKAPAHIREQGLDCKDADYRGFSSKEAKFIIKNFINRGSTPKLYNRLVRFLFLTGCRPGEAIGLQWEDVSEDCTKITFRHSYSKDTKELTGGKNARYEGKETRNFPCGEKLRNLLLEIKKDTPNPVNFVFLNSKSQPVVWATFKFNWAGARNGSSDSDGVLEALVRKGKIRFYLKPYATRHSFITWQLKAGMTPANVAKLVGTSPEMIYKHYVSADEDAKVAFEV